MIAHGERQPNAWGRLLGSVILPLAILATGCAPLAPAGEKKLQIVATTSIVGDVVRQVGGQEIELSVLLPLDSDPHSYDPSPRDLAAVSDADLLFVNGLGLEAFLQPLLENVGGEVVVVSVSQGIETRVLDEEAHEGEAPEGVDPHVWFDPANLIVWTRNIEQALIDLDPQHASAYTANARAYEARLQELDAWIQAQVEQVPEERRLMVTDHASFGYFADRYGFEQVGAVFPGFSTLAEPSAQELAALETAIADLGAPAIFVGRTVNPSLAERVGTDTGARVVTLYTGSLSAPDGPAADYISLMRYDVGAIVDALR